MIDPRELRIGNYVYFTDFPVIDRLVELTIDEFKNGNIWFEYFITPIPLTKQHLIDFGFKEYIDSSDEINFYNKLIDGNDPQINVSIIDCEVCIDGKVYLKHIKYVHQLQNLYFALTGKELTK